MDITGKQGILHENQELSILVTVTPNSVSSTINQNYKYQKTPVV